MNRAQRRALRILSALTALIVLAVLATGCGGSTDTGSPLDGDEGLFEERATPSAEAAAATASPVIGASPTTVEQADSAKPTPEPAEPTRQPEPSVAGRRYLGDPVSEFSAPASWRQLLSSDDRIRQDELRNGTRVVIQQNHSPGSQAQLRLVVAAGSIDDDPGSLGSAHFLEHMMFNGTEQFPGNELVPVLEGFGAGFGADVNAYTSFEETVYKLTVPTLDFADIELALDVLAQWAYGATIDPDAVVAERGVVREEYRRSKETASGRLSRVLQDAIFEGTPYAGRDPIGTIEAIESMNAPALQAYYEHWYRPDNLTVIAVGDFDQSAVHQAILERFDVAPGDRVADRTLDQANGSLSEPLFDVVIDPELSHIDLQVNWRLDGGPVLTRNDLRQSLVSELTAIVLDSRLFQAVQRQETALLSAHTSRGALTSRLDLATLRGQSEADAVPEALEELLQFAEELRQYPVPVAEFARAKERVIAGIEQRFAKSGSVQDSRLADLLVESALGGAAVMDPDTARDTSIEVLDTIVPVDLQTAMHTVLESAPYVLVSAPAVNADVLPGPEELAEVYARTVGFIVAEPRVAIAAPTALMVRPEQVDIVDEVYVEPLDITVYTYANGATLAAKRTSIVDNSVEFQAWSRGGFFQEEGPIVPLLGRSGELVLPSGFESLDTIALDQILGSHVVSLGGEINRSTEVLSGESSTEDLETLFQLVHLQMTEPIVDDLQIRRFDDFWRRLAEDPATRPRLAADRRLWSLRYGDSPYFRLVPTIEDLDSLDAEAQLSAFKRRFGNAADFVFVVVGDVDASVAGELGAAYLGTLPASSEREFAIDRDPGIPDENLVETIAVGIGDQGRLRINWESPYEASIASEVRAQALELVVDARLRDLIREQLGASYSPRASVSVLREPKPWVDTIIELDGDPERLAEVSATIRDELARIRVGEIDPNYVRLAITQLTESYRFYSNPDWIDFITTYLAYEDRPADEHRQRSDIARTLTLADISATARVVFPEARSVEVRMVPAN